MKRIYVAPIAYFLVAIALTTVSCSKSIDENDVEKSDAKQMLSFTFKKGANAQLVADERKGVVSENEQLVTVAISKAIDQLILVPTIQVSDKATVSPASGTAQDFSNAVTYTVTAENGSTRSYLVSLNQLNSEASIEAFEFLMTDNSLLTETITGTIDQEAKEILVMLPICVDLSNLVPSLQLSEGARLTSGSLDSQDFQDPVTYIISAEDGTQVTYTVRVSTQETTEREALIALYNANPGNTLDWDLSSMDISNWSGIELSNEQKVIGFQLRGSRITTIPEEVKCLQFLKSFRFNTSGLQNPPENLDNMPFLEHLELSFNELTEFPQELANLENLKSINFYGNKIGSVPNFIGTLLNLESMNLGFNNIQNISPEIRKLSKLKELSFALNSLSTIPGEILELENIVELNLGITNIQDISSTIGNLKKLERLVLAGNEISELPIEIGLLTELTDLNLSDNMLTSLPTEMGGLIKLVTLDLTKNELTTIPKEICDLNIANFSVDDGVVCE